MITAVAISPDGKLFAAGGDDHVVRIWSIDGPHLLHEMRGHNDWVRTVAFSPDGAILASAGDDRCVRLWDAESGNLLKNLHEHELSIFTVRFSPDGKTIAAAGFEDKLQIYSVATGEVLKTLDVLATTCGALRSRRTARCSQPAAATAKFASGIWRTDGSSRSGPPIGCGSVF